MNKIIGIIVEWNPFHNGHIKHLQEIRKINKDCIVIAAMSGNIVQRGEIAILDKFKRAQLAIDSNLVDIVVEIPSRYLLNSSEKFALGSVKLLNNFNAEIIISGSETNDTNRIRKINEKINSINSNELKEQIKKGISYPKAIENLIAIKMNSNDILNRNYINAIDKINKEIQFKTIKRDVAHDSLYSNKDIASGKLIRKLIFDNKKINNLIPNYDIQSNEVFKTEKLITLIKYKILINSLKNDEIINKLKKIITNDSAINYENLINKSCDKVNTKSKIKRRILNELFEVDENQKDYYRILGISKSGKNYLKKNKIKNSFSKYIPEQKNENRISKVIDIIYPGVEEKNIKENIYIKN